MSTPPSAPLLPRSQPPRPTPTTIQKHHAHSSPVVPPRTKNPNIPTITRPPSAPLVASLTSQSQTSSSSSSGGGVASGSTTTTTSTSSRPIITPTFGNGVDNTVLGSAAPIGTVSVPTATATGTANYPLQKIGMTSTTSSTTSVTGLLAAHAHAHVHAGTSTSTAASTPGPNHSVNQTPQTGASRMAAAAKRGLDGLPSAVGLAKMMKDEQEEDHPLSEKSLKARDYQTVHTLNRLFHLPSRWRLIRPLGQGAYGLVISVQDTLSGEPVAVKCITRVFDKVILARRALREITLLRHFQGHENLTGLIDLDHVWEGYNEIYLYMEPMEADLHQIVRSGQPLSNSHIQYFLYQLLRGMKYIHTANVIHRDLKPGNLLVNSDCELKICDFGLARGFRPVTGENDQNEEMRLTEYVATRWYRAPEVMLSNRRYTTAIDVWSIGCILAELLGLKPIFKGKDYVDQLNLILEVLGTPDDETLARVGSEKACAYIKTLPVHKKQEFATLFPEADPDAVDLLSQLLQFDPSERIDVITALSHPYLATYHDPLDEPSCHEIFEKWEQVESLTTIDELREAITREIREFREEVRTVDEEDIEAGWVLGVDQDGTGGGLRESPMPDVGGGFLGESLPVPVPHSVRDGLSPRTTISNLPVDGDTSSNPVARGVGVPFPVAGSRRASIKRDISPSTPATAQSEESFGNPFSASASATGSGRASRRASGHSTSMSMPMGRRPTSFLFSPLMTGMTPLTNKDKDKDGQKVDMTSLTNAFSSIANANEPGTGGGGGLPSAGWQGRRSRAPSQSGMAMGALIRSLSKVDFRGERDRDSGDADGDEEIPPMTVSPSDAPPSEVPKGFR